jgi:diaminopimelate epimerase
MKFTKMQGIGNDFVVVDAVSTGDGLLLTEVAERSVFLCDRQFEMRMFNPDGSEAEMCGNGIRCFAKYVFDAGLSKDTTLTIQTGAGLLTTDSFVEHGVVSRVKVDMGQAILDRALIPIDFQDGATGPVVSARVEVLGREFRITGVSMGNPHCVIFVDDVASFPLQEFGPAFESHPAFPRRINTEFVQVVNHGEVKMRVWERGAAETLACGTGACAVAVASSLNHHTSKTVRVHLAGGDLDVTWNENGRVEMTGAAETVFAGDV